MQEFDTISEKVFGFLGSTYVTDAGDQKQVASGNFINRCQGLYDKNKFQIKLWQDRITRTPKNVYVASDLHLGHANIIKYCDRPFESPDHMNAVLLENFKATLTDKDILIIVGDLAMNFKVFANPFLRQLACKKMLIVGNHDHDRKEDFFKFDVDIMLPWFSYGDKVFTHYPMPEFVLNDLGFETNVHGHIHNQPLHPMLGKGNRHINVSMEMHDYKPTQLEI